MRTALRNLSERFRRVDCLVCETVGSSRLYEVPNNLLLSYVGPIEPFGSLASKLRGAIARGNSLNEVVFQKSNLWRTCQAGSKCDLVYCDSIRLAQYAAALQKPWILDLDDLLSERFKQYADTASDRAESILGHFADQIPAIARKIVDAFSKRICSFEARRLKARELYWITQASVTSLVSEIEVAKIAPKTPRPVLHLPMAIRDFASTWAPRKLRDRTVKKVVFVGYLKYAANAQSINKFASMLNEVNAGKERVRCTVVGSLPESGLTREARNCRWIEYAGYVECLEEALRDSDAFVAPIWTGTGVKTKVLEAMRFGIPVLGTPMAFDGIGEANNVGLVWKDVDSFLSALSKLNDSEYVEQLTAHAKAVVDESFSIHAVRSKWQLAIDLALKSKCSTPFEKV